MPRKARATSTPSGGPGRRGPLDDALVADPATAASAVFHAPEEALTALVPTLAARAATHEDAHLAKYTLACLTAAATDTSERRLYLAAAAYLGAWWKAFSD